MSMLQTDTRGTAGPLAPGPPLERRAAESPSIPGRVSRASPASLQAESQTGPQFLIITDLKWRFDFVQNGNFNRNKASERRNADKKEKKSWR